MAYRNYFDPQQLRTDAEQNLPWLRALLDRIQSTARGFTPQPGILVYGFSRGAQMAHRFSMLYPDQVAAEATLSAGSYTLPQALDADRVSFRHQRRGEDRQRSLRQHGLRQH
jgi:hypothetical protein